MKIIQILLLILCCLLVMRVILSHNTEYIYTTTLQEMQDIKNRPLYDLVVYPRGPHYCYRYIDLLYLKEELPYKKAYDEVLSLYESLKTIMKNLLWVKLKNRNYEESCASEYRKVEVIFNNTKNLLLLIKNHSHYTMQMDAYKMKQAVESARSASRAAMMGSIVAAGSARRSR